MTDPDDEAPIPISALQHAVYCLRQAALIHLERMWAENRHTAEGAVLHAASDRGDERRVRGVRRVNALPLRSERLGLVGVADLVEFVAGAGGETARPVEFKRGKPKAHRADEVQLCAQALCLEEMTGRPVPEGALFYGETRRRVVVRFDGALRAETEAAAAALAAILRTGTTPPPTHLKSRCRLCSLAELCRPDMLRARASAGAWRHRVLHGLLAGEAAADPAG